MTWRTGRKVGRTIYLQRGPKPSDDDPLIGVMDTPELAAQVIAAVNAEHKATEGRHRRHGVRVRWSDIFGNFEYVGDDPTWIWTTYPTKVIGKDDGQ